MNPEPEFRGKPKPNMVPLFIAAPREKLLELQQPDVGDLQLAPHPFCLASL
jgi:hypothetical protein